MELTDGTVTLRSPDDADAPAVAAAVRATLPELEPWMPWATAAYDEDAALAWIRGEFDPGGHSFVMVSDDGTIVGSSGLNRIDELNRCANLGYWLRTDATGRGWATRATRLLARYGIREVGLHRVEVIMSVENEASRRVAERAGATHEGIMRGGLLLRNRHHDVHLFSFTADDNI